MSVFSIKNIGVSRFNRLTPIFFIDMFGLSEKICERDGPITVLALDSGIIL
jgi:hypothetical protein